MLPDELLFRRAAREDLPRIVALLADDFLGEQRERFATPLPESYEQAFAEIERDDNNELIVVEHNGEVIATLQITFVPSISFQGRRRAQIESVRVESTMRGQGIGKKLFQWAIEKARQELSDDSAFDQ